VDGWLFFGRKRSLQQRSHREEVIEPQKLVNGENKTAKIHHSRRHIMANENVAGEELLLDVRVAEASRLYKFYLNQERKILGTISVGIFLLIWELVGNTFQLINPMFMSAPSLIAKAAVQLFASGEIWNDLYVSGIEFFWGYGLSVIVAIPFGIAIGWYKRFAYVCDPFVNAMNATPRVALLPLVIIWLGIGILSKVGIIFLGAVFPLLINTRDGVKTTPANLLTAARSFGASEWQIFKSVVLPSTVPFILTGLRLAIGRALIGVMVGELYAATAGIGFMITVAGATFQTDKVFVGVLIFAITGMIMTDMVDRWEHRFDKWRPKVGAE
jgi:NitT/TauT family transport system permease protein